jgi:uncharacterized protein
MGSSGTIRKNALNLRKHGLDFSQGTRMFSGPILLVEPDIREDYGEDRWIGLGMIGDIVAVVVFTLRRDIQRGPHYLAQRGR